MSRDDPNHWEGDTDALISRLSGGPSRPASRLEGAFATAAITAALLAVAAFFTWRASQPPSFHVLATGEGQLMWVNQRTGRVGGCVMRADRVSCLRDDWATGPDEP